MWEKLKEHNVLDSFLWCSFFLQSHCFTSGLVYCDLKILYHILNLGSTRPSLSQSSPSVFKRMVFLLFHIWYWFVCMSLYVFHSNFCYFHQIMQELKLNFVLLYVCVLGMGRFNKVIFAFWFFFLDGSKLLLCGFSWAWLFEIVKV